MGFLGGPPTDSGPDVPAVTTPDQVARGKSTGQGIIQSGLWADFFQKLLGVIQDFLSTLITVLAGLFDFLVSKIVPFLTASQGQNTSAFYDLVAQLLNDLLGVEVAGSDISAAADKRGRIGAMQQVGGDLFTTLANEFIGKQPDAGAGEGIAGLPGTPGTPLTPEQGVAAAKAFIGFLLSFSVRQGNVAVFTDALSWHLLGQIREYGEMMAKNLGLSRMARRALQPFVQTLIAGPLQEGLNRQYRPHVMDAKQLASAYIRNEIDRSDYADRLRGIGYKEGDIDLLISDTYARLRLEDAFLLHENGILTDADLAARVSALGFNQSDIGLLVQARQYAAVQGADRQYAEILAAQLFDGVMAQSDYDAAIGALRIPKLEADALTRNAVARRQHKHKALSLGFLKKAYLNAGITLDELLAHLVTLGYSQDDIDIIEVEVLTEQKQHAATAAAKAAKAAAKAAGKSVAATPPKTG